MCIVEQIERFVQRDQWSIELYSQQVSQLSGIQSAAARTSQDSSAGIHWHKVSDIPGPHLLKFIWWFYVNHWQRWRDRRSGRVRPDLVYTPGTNCLDADAIMVQIVFHAFYEQARGELLLRRVPLKTWPRLIHRKLYYKLIMFLERKIYRNPRVCLVAVSNLIARQLQMFLGRTDVIVIPNTVDISRFNPETRRARRPALRNSFRFSENDFVVLLIGNDWKKKGLDSLLRAAARLRDFPLRLMVVGKDDLEFYRSIVRKLGLQDRISFENPASDVVQFYALADLYVGPSLEDGFNLPILEAMACGLPVIASIHTGASENISDGQNGLILNDPQDDALLAQLINRLYADDALRQRIAEAAAAFVQEKCCWDQNAAKTRDLLEAILRRRSSL
jgi:UDP-glucose:(heptosyl)LPS alpha-1,3-glucosyltransferase